MKIIGLLISLILTNACLEQFKVIDLAKNAISKDIHYDGKIVQAVRWTDNSGDNTVILTTTGKTQSKNMPDDSYSDAALYAYHFLDSGGGMRQTWKVSDYVKKCPLDILLFFVDETFAVTDLNKDDRAEVWIMYKV